MFEKQKEMEIDFFKSKEKKLSKWSKIKSLVSDLRIIKPIDWLASALLISIVFGFSETIKFEQQIKLLSSTALNQGIYNFYIFFLVAFIMKKMFIFQFKYHGEPFGEFKKSLITILQQGFIGIMCMPIIESKITPAMYALIKVIKYLFVIS